MLRVQRFGGLGLRALGFRVSKVSEFMLWGFEGFGLRGQGLRGLGTPAVEPPVSLIYSTLIATIVFFCREVDGFQLWFRDLGLRVWGLRRVEAP